MKKVELGQVFTSKLIAKHMVALFSIPHDSKILDPCFGGAVFIDALVEDNYSDITGCELDDEWYNKAAEKFNDVTLFNGDFLKYHSDELFDGIIMNPPYIRQERIDDLSEYGITKRTLRSDEIYNILPKTANLYMYFVLKGVSLLKDNGEMVIIFPSSWIDAKNGDSFKSYIYNQCDVVEQIHISGNVFEGDAIVDVIILKIIKRKSTGSTSVQYMYVKDDILIPVNKNVGTISLDFNCKLLRYASVRRGLTTGFNEIFINPDDSYELKEYLDTIISSPKDVVGYSTQNAHCDNLLIIRKDDEISDELRRYIVNNEIIIKDTGKPKTLYSKICRNEPWYEITPFDGKGIIFSYFVRNEMKFILNHRSINIRDNFYIIKPKINDYLMLALLNNYYTYYQLEKRGKKYGAGLLKLQRYDIEELMFPDTDCMDDADIKKIISLAKELVKHNDPSKVEEITRVISDTTSVSFEVILDEYAKVKRSRLENAK